jgi:hypothetical protein
MEKRYGFWRKWLATKESTLLKIQLYVRLVITKEDLSYRESKIIKILNEELRSDIIAELFEIIIFLISIFE